MALLSVKKKKLPPEPDGIHVIRMENLTGLSESHS